MPINCQDCELGSLIFIFPLPLKMGAVIFALTDTVETAADLAARSGGKQELVQLLRAVEGNRASYAVGFICLVMQLQGTFVWQAKVDCCTLWLLNFAILKPSQSNKCFHKEVHNNYLTLSWLSWQVWKERWETCISVQYIQQFNIYSHCMVGLHFFFLFYLR